MKPSGEEQGLRKSATGKIQETISIAELRRLVGELDFYKRQSEDRGRQLTLLEEEVRKLRAYVHRGR